ncbi:serine/threonine protein kinase [Tengunoibacter tsumagoiensis]|uniref:non-specific serine/threonine protein kinase n=1 Tax=Tengunoibacter tsumagoiensis TaxID=2014871 RepID=A0A401ZV20_9CHLR|nr:serine/threonine-protein kinase [Tengunoibacter tsumagoiensis]GCE10765.1 hypothetical protein KTT_06240 [Tengunoibacter tsumagoiensis]
MSDRTGQIMGNYRLLRLLGQGGYAEVYLGEHLYLPMQAAIKIVHGQIEAGELESFKREAKTIAILKHPHILRIFDFDFAGLTPFIVMDYIPHGTLRDRYPLGSIMPLPLLVKYVKQIGSALHYAHQQRFIHQDVKPENILLENEQNVILSDFGFATLVHNTASLPIQNALGTVQYMAPEQIQGKPRPASDQYALSLMVYEWLCGTRPFKSRSFNDLMLSQLKQVPPTLRSQGARIPQAVEQVVLTALSKEPHQRFSNIQAFVNALEQAAMGTPLIRKS